MRSRSTASAVSHIAARVCANSSTPTVSTTAGELRGRHVAAGDEPAEVHLHQAGQANVGEDQVPRVAALHAGREQPHRREAHRLLVTLGGVGRPRAERHAADVDEVRRRRDPPDERVADEHRPADLDVLRVVAATAVRVVGHEHVARRERGRRGAPACARRGCGRPPTCTRPCRRPRAARPRGRGCCTSSPCPRRRSDSPRSARWRPRPRRPRTGAGCGCTSSRIGSMARASSWCSLRRVVGCEDQRAARVGPGAIAALHPHRGVAGVDERGPVEHRAGADAVAVVHGDGGWRRVPFELHRPACAWTPPPRRSRRRRAGGSTRRSSRRLGTRVALPMARSVISSTGTPIAIAPSPKRRTYSALNRSSKPSTRGRPSVGRRRSGTVSSDPWRSKRRSASSRTRHCPAGTPSATRSASTPARKLVERRRHERLVDRAASWRATARARGATRPSPRRRRRTPTRASGSTERRAPMSCAMSHANRPPQPP